MKFSLSIRQKVIIGLTVSLLAVACIGAISYRYLMTIKTKLHVIELADDLSNIILEIRRYEKNYLLYGSLEDLHENQDYIREAKLVMSGMQPEVTRLSIAPKFNRLSRSMQDYAAAMDQLSGCGAPDTGGCVAIAERMRESGKELVDVSHLLVRFERDQILENLNSLETNLVSSLLILIVVGSGFTVLVGTRIVRPLKRIEDSTLRIAGGDFTPLSSASTGDETQRVIEAFNRMIAELETRQEQLVQAKKLSSIGILASGIAHQLNNPLNNISTSLQIVDEEFGHGDPEFIRRLLKNCGQEILRAQEIVKGLLEFSRQREFELRPAVLADIVQRSIRLISSQVPAGIDIKSDVPSDMVLEMDVQRMQEVFINLLMNAVQAMETGAGQIRIRAQPLGAASKRAAEIVIEDTGKGITPEDMGRIFDPFFTTKDVGAGTGLGLSIAYGIIQKHHGTITVESRRGEGTRFIIRLPISGSGEALT
jgi:two-component system, NtrC family, sensor kinase